jgi:hypothetical protein
MRVLAAPKSLLLLMILILLMIFLESGFIAGSGARS